MTDAEPTRVFARFPWPQLIFCVACLSMTGWTWMRYSYCWRMTSEEILKPRDRIGEHRWPAEAYVEFDYRKYMVLAEQALPTRPWLIVEFSGFSPEPDLFIRRGRWSPWFMTRGDPDTRGSEITITLEAASRFHGASIAGLVVGAMGCFIFGLYLRRWLRERNSAAPTPMS